MAGSNKYPGQFTKWYEACKTLAESLYASVNSRGHLEVEVASQISPIFIGHFYKMNNGWTTITAEAVVGAYTITVADATGAAIGESIIISDTLNERYFYAHITNVASLTLTLDTPLDYPYANGSDLAIASHDMNVNGSVTPQVFGIRQAENPSNLQENIELDITRILLFMETAASCDLATFGDQAALARGIVLRKKNTDGTYNNIFNIRKNGDMAAIGYDLNIYAATNPVAGQDGVSFRLTFGGEEKMGTVIRLGPGEDLELVVQDNLTGITEMTMVAEGALVAD